MRKLMLLLAVLLCVSLAACKAEKKERIAPTRSTDPILNLGGSDDAEEEIHTPVYVTVFGDTAYLSVYPQKTNPKDTDELENEPECAIREISGGGKISCGGTHEGEEPIVRVVIMDAVYPNSTAEWFRDMTALRVIEGLGNLHIDNVTDMNNMFNGCVRLSELEINGWDVSGVTDMTDMFAGCDSLASRPTWYQE
ncbi:MAG: BspA family leucine-rich repeat surface protein [Ruminococcaceae bacterium]|nr:BspA family leucine-rich repeat surface protein [Oscillospiraceae bacterium]MBQ3215552.1 BspA family leucine-rich repeat surface protein [Oscillospiraceae bacterium]